MPDARVILIVAAIGAVVWSGDKIGHGIKVLAVKADHKIVHVFHPHRKPVNPDDPKKVRP